ncbi:LysR family transcriptional regulator [Streptomyces sp. FH025]|uniref:LysR family transcriptional regulator n=1 Tax=Streptomyces sp. FH025 TaxID=2815937 RepID=UPI001A9EE5CD|nr:LysR family transcriptional regulator [Streptomyces sp. FH025]MBO1416069.1 LysR family transcriptional regulator [Streptomyces sp. FH025]
MLFRQLEYLVALARERHFARAAQACHVSQPALSEAVRKLEDELEVLLVRRGRAYEGLTPEGERIVLWAQRILADRDALRDEVDALRTGLSGRLRIGSVPTASGAVSLLTGPFCTAHPLAAVELSTDLRSDELLRQVRNFEVDAGITYLPGPEADDLRAVPLYEERYVLLTGLLTGLPTGPPTGLPTGPPTGPPEEQARHPHATWTEASRLPLCLLHAGMQGRRVLDEVFAGLGLAPTPRVETDSVASLFAHVRTGQWASVVPYAWLHVFGVPPGMRAVPLVEPVHSAPIGLVVAAREPGSAMARALLEVARRTDVAAVLGSLPQA